jgi:hypothetical protein
VNLKSRVAFKGASVTTCTNAEEDTQGGQKMVVGNCDRIDLARFDGLGFKILIHRILRVGIEEVNDASEAEGESPGAKYFLRNALSVTRGRLR